MYCVQHNVMSAISICLTGLKSSITAVDGTVYSKVYAVAVQSETTRLSQWKSCTSHVAQSIENCSVLLHPSHVTLPYPLASPAFSLKPEVDPPAIVQHFVSHAEYLDIPVNMADMSLSKALEEGNTSSITPTSAPPVHHEPSKYANSHFTTHYGEDNYRQCKYSFSCRFVGYYKYTI